MEVLYIVIILFIVNCIINAWTTYRIIKQRKELKEEINND